jgi:hypothetical protein
MANGRSKSRREVSTDFTTTTDASLRWPRDVYEGGKGHRWRPHNVRRPEPGFTLTFKNDIGTQEEVQPKTTDAKSCHYTLEQEAGRPVPGRATTESFSQYKAPPRYALNMQPDERYMLRKDKNQSVLPQQCGLPGPRVRVMARGGGAPDWQQHSEEVMQSEEQYRLTGEAGARVLHCGPFTHTPWCCRAHHSCTNMLPPTRAKPPTTMTVNAVCLCGREGAACDRLQVDCRARRPLTPKARAKLHRQIHE